MSIKSHNTTIVCICHWFSLSLLCLSIVACGIEFIEEKKEAEITTQTRAFDQHLAPGHFTSLSFHNCTWIAARNFTLELHSWIIDYIGPVTMKNYPNWIGNVQWTHKWLHRMKLELKCSVLYAMAFGNRDKRQRKVRIKTLQLIRHFSNAFGQRYKRHMNYYGLSVCAYFIQY